MPIITLTRNAVLGGKLILAGTEVEMSDTSILPEAYQKAQSLRPNIPKKELDAGDFQLMSDRIKELVSDIEGMKDMLHGVPSLTDSLRELQQEVETHANQISRLIHIIAVAESIHSINTAVQPMQEWANKHIENGEI